MKILLQLWTAVVLAALLCAPARSQNSGIDPTVMGPLAVSSSIYDFGDTALTLPGFPGPVEFRGSVHYPADLSGAPHKLLVLFHGRHDVCQNGNVPGSFTWPCPNGQTPIPSFQGYDYIAQNLASNGYIVVSISANGINAVDNTTSDLGASARAQLLQKHLDLWNTFNTTGGAPFGTLFVGKIDMQHIGTMGHSRGGEGVVRHFLFNQSVGTPYGIKAVFAVAPTDFNHEVINRVPLAVILPYCDGDVFTLEGVHFYDDSRYNMPGDPSQKHTMLVMGADHNLYNTVWTPGLFPGAMDDWTATGDAFCGTGIGNQRLSPVQQQATGLAFVGGFLRANVGGESQFQPLLVGASSVPSINPAITHFSYHAPDSHSFRMDVNRLADATSLTTDQLGGAVTQSGLSPYTLCGGPAEPSPCFALSIGQQPHTDSFSGTGVLSQLMMGWSAPSATYTYQLPAGHRDVHIYQALQFRAGVNFTDGRNAGGVPQDLTVTLTDGSNRTAIAHVNTVAPNSLFFPPGGTVPVPKIILNTVRVPLTSFSGVVTMGDIRSIQFRFDRTASGALMIADVAFASIVH